MDVCDRVCAALEVQQEQQVWQSHNLGEMVAEETKERL